MEVMVMLLMTTVRINSLVVSCLRNNGDACDEVNLKHLLYVFLDNQGKRYNGKLICPY